MEKVVSIQFSEKAIKEIKRLQSQEPNKKLRVGVKTGGCSGLSYVLSFDEKQENDLIFKQDGFSFIMNPMHEIYLSKMIIHFDDGLNARGFTFENPNATSTCGCGNSFSTN